MASAPQQQQSEQEKAEIKLGQEQTSRARTKSKPLLSDYRRKMNRDDSSRLGGMAAADVMQAAGQDRSGQQLASGQGGGHTPSGLDRQLLQATDNASNVALSRQDSMKSAYGALGNKKNMDSVASLKASAGAASHVAAAEAEASMTKQNAMLDSATSLAAAKGLSMYDKYDRANMAYQKAEQGVKRIGHPALGNFQGLDQSRALKRKRDSLSGASWFNKYS